MKRKLTTKQLEIVELLNTNTAAERGYQMVARTGTERKRGYTAAQIAAMVGRRTNAVRDSLTVLTGMGVVTRRTQTVGQPNQSSEADLYYRVRGVKVTAA